MCGLHEKTNPLHPPSPYQRGGTRDAARPRHSARARNFWLIRRMSVGVGGLACARFQALQRIVDATERDPRLPCWVLGGRCRTDWRRRSTGGGLGVAGEDVFGDALRRRSLPGSASSSLGHDVVDGGRES